ncbi:hypothetical protein ACQ4PT_037451 [Festuca glaucescens]
MASPSPKDQDAAVPSPPSSRETSSSPPRARAPRRSDMGTGCAALCFHLPRRSKKKQTPLAKLNSNKSVDEQPAVVDASSPPRVTFLASASLSTWWPSSPGAPGGDVAWRRTSSSVRGAPAGGRRALSSSFSYWRRSQQSSSRVMPHGGAASARMSFSFPSSPMSVSSCMSTPKISHGCEE